MKILTARLFYCLRCNALVIICSVCDRGQIYCGGECSSLARSESLRAAGKRYQDTLKGKLNHAERQRSYRQRQQEKKEKRKKVTHQGIQQNSHRVSLQLQEPIRPKIDTLHCHFCKNPVSEFLRRYFLGSCRNNSLEIDNYLARAL